MRIGMIGTSRRHQGQGHGRRMLFAAAGLARAVGRHVAVRYLVADANDTALGWYLELGWVPNESEREQQRLANTALTSIRLDLGRPLPTPA